MQSLTQELAAEAIKKAMDLATKDYQRPVCVSVCDENGYLINFVRMDGAPIRCIEIALRKAYTAARMGISTGAFLNRLRQEQVEIGYFGDALFTALPGGSVIKNEVGQVIGAIGVSGLATSEDEKISEAVAAWASNQP